MFFVQQYWSVTCENSQLILLFMNKPIFSNVNNLIVIHLGRTLRFARPINNLQ